MKSEELSKKKFYQWLSEKRRSFLEEEGIELGEIDSGTLTRLNTLSENVVGQVRLPLEILPRLIVNKKSYCVLMAVEEPSVVATANHVSKIFNQNGGAETVSIRNGIYGQIVLEVAHDFGLVRLTKELPELVEPANREFAGLAKHGGGARKIEASREDNLVSLKVLVGPAEAMGANKTDAILESLGNKLEKQIDVEQTMHVILSSYPTQLITAKTSLDINSTGGPEVAKKIVLPGEAGQTDIYRATTNDKGTMNGVDSVLAATGNDYCGVEAVTVVRANKDGSYTPLSKWDIANDRLIGTVTIPLAIDVAGGSIKARQDIQQSFNLLGKVSAKQLAKITAATGLTNNFSTLLVISIKGVQAGHMKLQTRNLVTALKANEDEKAKVLEKLQESKQHAQEIAVRFLDEIRKEKN